MRFAIFIVVESYNSHINHQILKADSPLEQTMLSLGNDLIAAPENQLKDTQIAWSTLRFVNTEEYYVL